MNNPDRDRWQSLSELLDRALDMPEAERAAWLRELEAEHPDRAGELRALLAARDQRDFGDFLAGSAPAAPQGPEAQAVIGRRIGPYVIESEIGRGGMGSVWRAVRVDGHFEGHVAIKLVHASWLGREGEQRFRREGKLLARLDHPHIARLIDAGVLDDSQPYLVLEYIEGVPIDAYCTERRLDVAARVELFLGVLDAVAHAHSHLIVHRDIKPSNVMVTRDGRAKLLDFGIAKPLGADEGLPGLTRSGTSALTPDYAAPEQLLGEPVTTLTDEYALGLVLYRLLTGTHALARESRSTADFIKAILEQETPCASVTANDPVTRRALEGDLDNILAKALKKRPDERYPSVGAFADDLRRFLTFQPVLARPDTVTYRMAKFVRRHRGGVATALLMLVALIGATVITATQMVEARHQRDLAQVELRRAEAFNDLVAIVLSESGRDGGSLTTSELLDRGERLVRSEFASTPTLRAQLMYSLAELELQVGLTGREHRLTSESLDLAMKTGDKKMIALMGCALVESDSWNGNLQGARDKVERYIAMLPEDRSSDVARAQCLLSASIIERNQGDGDRALDYAERGNAILQASASVTQWEKLNAMVTLADAERSAGRLAKADESYKQVSAGFDRLNLENTSSAATLYNNWALDLVNLGQPGRAAVLFKRVMDYNKTLAAPNPSTGVAYATALVPLGRVAEARGLLELAYAAALANGNRASADKARMGLAGTYRELGLLDGSEEMLRTVEGDVGTLLPPGHEAFGALHLNKALLAQKRQNYASALSEVDAALAIFSKNHGLAHRAAIARLTRAEILLALGRAGEARADVSQSMTALQRIIEPGVKSLHVGRAWLVTAQIDAKAGDTGAAHAAARQAYEHLEATVGAQHPLTVAAHDLAGYR